MLNKNGETLIDLSELNDIKIIMDSLNTKIYINVYSDTENKKAEVLIDYIIISNRATVTIKKFKVRKKWNVEQTLNY